MYLMDEHELPETGRFTVFVTAAVNLYSLTFTLSLNVAELNATTSDTNGITKSSCRGYDGASLI